MGMGIPMGMDPHVNSMEMAIAFGLLMGMLITSWKWKRHI